MDTAPINKDSKQYGVSSKQKKNKLPTAYCLLPTVNKGVSATESFHINKIIILISIALILRAILNYTPPITPLKVGDSAPAFLLNLKDGTVLNFNSIKGNPTVIFFYANWCPCSNLSAPFIKQAFEEFGHKGVNFISIGFQDKETDLMKFIERHKLQFPSGADKEQEIAGSYGVSTPPTTIFINREGKITSIFVGKIKKYEDVAERIRKITEVRGQRTEDRK
ncbi:MAG: TlpA family protein disulfide reductase [Nitrospinae bacterium]|nr:TlpA family protein disulfide reductase [Nitrospinota bacterium]